MVANEHPGVIEGRQRFIATGVIDSQEEDEDGFIDNYGADLDEEDESVSVEEGVRTYFTQSGTEEVEEVQRVFRFSSLSSYMLKPPSLLTQSFNKNKKAHENLFKRMCNFWSRAKWRNGRRSISSYIGVDIINDQYRMVNLTPLECIAGYIIQGAIGDRDLKRLPQKILNMIVGSI